MFRHGLHTILPLLITLALSPLPAAAAEIHEAAQAGDRAVVAALLDADPAQVSLADARGCLPLHFAADGGATAVIALLLDHGAATDVTDIDGDTPLHWAAFRGRIEAMDLLLAHGAELEARNHGDETPFYYTVKMNEYAAAAWLLDRGADIEAANDYARTPLLWVARERGNLRMARLLLDRGADVNAADRFGDTPLNLASWRGFRTLVDMLMDAGASVPTSGNQANQLLFHATERGLAQLYAALADGGMAIDVGADENGGFLHLAAAGGAAPVVADLLARGAAVDAVDRYGWTPLHYAASRGRAEAVALLLDAGADADAATLSGRTPLSLAAARPSAETITELRAQGARRDSRNFPDLSGPWLGQTPPAAGAAIFAPDIVATCFGEHGNVCFTPDGREAYWSGGCVAPPDSGYTGGVLLTSRLENGRWSEPAPASFAIGESDDVPFVTPDGSRLFFMSSRSLTPGGPDGAEHIWVVDREGDGWGEPQPLPPCVNDMRQHWQIAVAANGNLYFSSRREDRRGIFVSHFENGEYTEPEELGFVGDAPFIAPDESYLIVFEFSQTGPRNAIRFRRGDGGWGEPVDIAEAAGPSVSGLCPIVSPDGRWFFFLARGIANNIHWTSADFIEELRRRHAES